MSVIWEQQMEREMEERYSEWKQTVSTDEPDWTFVPLDKPSTWQRDYGKLGMYETPKYATTHLLLAFGISGVLLVLFICGVNYVSKVVAR